MITIIIIIVMMTTIHLKGKLSKWNPPGAVGEGGRFAIADTVAGRQNESGL